jgi:hypothetical protein
MKRSEKFSLDEWLSDYPEDKTYDEVCDLLLDADASVLPWQWFETMPPSELVENIENTRSHFEHTIIEIKEKGEFA